MRALTPLLAALGALAIALPAQGAENLLTNPGFEEIDEATGFPAGWEPTYWSNPHGTIEAADVAHSGQRSVVLRGLPREQITDAGKANNHLVAQELGDRVIGMRRLTLRAWVRTEGDGAARLSAFTYDAEGNRLQYDSSRTWTGLDDWTEVAMTITTDPATARLLIYLRNAGAGAVWYDDVGLTSSEDVLDSGPAQIIVDPLVGGRVRSFNPVGGAERTVWYGVLPGGWGAEIVPANTYPGVLRDAPYQAAVLEPNRRLLLRHEIADPELAGLVVEKTYALPEGSATLEVSLKVTNAGDRPREWALRAQQCLPPTGGICTWPTEQGLRVYRHPEYVMKTEVPIDDLAGGWIGHVLPEGDAGTVMLFDGARVTKALLYFAYDLQTIEWYYRPVQLAPGDTWETTYRVASLGPGGPVVYADDQVALALAPLQFGAEGDYALSLHALGAEHSRELTVAGTLGTGDREAFEDTLKARALQPARLDLPWTGLGVQRVEVELRGPGEPQRIDLAQATVNDEPLRDLPPPPSDAERYAGTPGFFVYGEYYRGYRGETGSLEEFVDYNLREYRRCYLNTYIIGEGSLLGQFRDAGESWMAETAREFDMRLFPKGEFLRVFDRTGEALREIFPGNYTREQAVERIEATGYDLALRKAFQERYGDNVVAWDVSDEPGAEHIPNYVMVQSVFDEIDPDLPALTILNLSRTEFLPYMPIYYGDEYPIRNTGRRPWQVYDLVRFCATHTRAPVWVMLQAFGGREGYSWYLPTGPEMRMMVYSVLAAGGKGITFHGSFSPPCWRFDHHYFYTACDSWGAATPAWEAMREAGRFVTAIGAVMQDTEVDEGEPFTVRCEQLETEGGYAGPGVRLGILRERGGGSGRFIVAVSQDMNGPQQAALMADPKAIAEDALLFDLFDLAEIGPARSEHAFDLAAGDARIFFCGSREAGEAVMDAVHGAHYRNELPLFRIDAALAEANGLDVTEARALAEAAGQAHAAGSGTQAARRILEAHGMAQQALEADPAVGPAQAGLAEALELLTPIAHTFRDNFDVVVPPKDREGHQRYEPWQNTQDPRMQQFTEETVQCFIDRLALERRLYAGEAAAIAPEVADLLERARRLNAQAIPYVLTQAEEARGQ